MKREDAIGMLNLTPPLTAEQVTQAFRKAVVMAHPDTAPIVVGFDLAPLIKAPTVSELLQAKKMLLENLDGTEIPCAQCRGSGRVATKGMFGEPCGACKGKGVKQ